jgi:hypothetical protein
MQIKLKQYPGFNLPQTMRGMMSNLKVEMVLTLGMMNMVMKMLLPTPRRSRWQRWQRFPTSGKSRSALPEVEEVFRLRCRLRKIWGK